MQFNEAYGNGTPNNAKDGGAFDIDYYNSNNTYQYNYGHDNMAYCVAIFGSGNSATVNSIVRYNVCSNNSVDGARV